MKYSANRFFQLVEEVWITVDQELKEEATAWQTIKWMAWLALGAAAGAVTTKLVQRQIDPAQTSQRLLRACDRAAEELERRSMFKVA
jgi:hypothetical protein